MNLPASGKMDSSEGSIDCVTQGRYPYLSEIHVNFSAPLNTRVTSIHYGEIELSG
jgi:hypothetical protein